MVMVVFPTLILFVFGAVLGSFLNVVIYRVPRGLSIIYPPSHCPYCGHRLSATDLIPIVSYILLKGKCRYCGRTIPIRYLLVELLSAFWLPAAWYFSAQNVGEFVRLAIFGLFAIALTFIDIEHFLLPDVLVFPLLGSLVIVDIIRWLLGSVTQLDMLSFLIGALTSFLMLLVIHLVYPDGMGEGDVKLALAVGWFVGFPSVLVWFFFAFGLGAVVGIFLGIVRRQRILPFGPFMLIAAVLAYLWGGPVILWYRRTFWG